MSSKFVVSDTHFDHDNIIRYCQRPFKDVNEMNEALITKWNSVVKTNDVVYHLGDFAFKGREDAIRHFERLNGQKILIVGNHDDKNTFKLGWKEVHSYLEIKHLSRKLVFFHYPIARWNKKDGGSIHCHGHTHNTPLETVQNRFNVAVELIDHTPVNLDDIVAQSIPADKIKPDHD